MAKFGDWIKRAVKQVLNPDHEERIRELANLILQNLQQSRERFSLEQATK
jgi:hypothetical protein